MAVVGAGADLRRVVTVGLVWGWEVMVVAEEMEVVGAMVEGVGGVEVNISISIPPHKLIDGQGHRALLPAQTCRRIGVTGRGGVAVLPSEGCAAFRDSTPNDSSLVSFCFSCFIPTLSACLFSSECKNILLAGAGLCFTESIHVCLSTTGSCIPESQAWVGEEEWS